MSSIQDELGLVPGLHSLIQRFRDLLAKRGIHLGQDGERPLDPMIVDSEAWREMRRNVRAWPDYREAANTYSLLVSQADWDEYWGVDTGRKAANVARYLLREAAGRGLWIAGTPQVSLAVSEDVRRGAVRVSSSFSEARGQAHPVSERDLPEQDDSVAPASAYVEGEGRGHGRGPSPHVARAAHEVVPGTHVRSDETVVVRRRPALERVEIPREEAPADRTAPLMRPQGVPAPEGGVSRQLRYAMPEASPDQTIVLRRAEAPVRQDEPRHGAKSHVDDTVVLPADVPAIGYLTDGNSFRMAVHPGDVIGAVQEGLEMPLDVNLRLDGEGFPGVEPRQLSLAATAAGWTVTNLAQSGTTVEKPDGELVSLGQGEVSTLEEGDTLRMGSARPLRFHAGE